MNPEIRYPEHKHALSVHHDMEDQIVMGTVQSILPDAEKAYTTHSSKTILGLYDKDQDLWTMVSTDTPLNTLRPLIRKGKGEERAFVIIRPKHDMAHLSVSTTTLKRIFARFMLESFMVDTFSTKGLYLTDRCFDSGLQPHNGRVQVFDRRSTLGAPDTRFALKA